MTTRAADSMPDLPKPSKYDEWAGSPAYYTVDQMHQYARDYAAALSQTAGVALSRYGRGSTESPWLLEMREDGYWTPWHVAQQEVDRLTSVRQREPDVSEAMVECAWMAFTGRDKLGAAYARDAECMLDEERSDMRAALEAALAAAPAASATSKTYDRCTDPENCKRCSEDASTPHAGIPHAAPAASGGEYPGCSGDPASCPENEGHGCCKPNPARHVAIVCDWKNADPFPRFIEAEIGGKSVWLEWRDRPDGLKELIVPVTAAPQPPSAASVSERARSASLKEIVPAEKRNYLDDNGNPRSIEDEAYAHGWNACRAATLRAIEQALTQQRGSDSDLPFATTQRVVRALLHLGHGVPEGHEEQYARSNELVLTLCSEVMASTTPQPGAEALRELVRRILDWQPLTSINKADRLYQILVAAGLPFESVTDELESLLGRGGK